MNKLYRILTWCCVLMCSTWSVSAQDSLAITAGSDTVVLHATRLYGDVAYQELAEAADLEALRHLSGFNVQMSSPGRLATGLSNGMGARHLAILWEGWNIQSPFNGTMDLNLMPWGIFNKSSYVNQSYHAASGNAAMSGAILLSPSDREGFRLSHEINSFGNHCLAYQAGITRGSGRASISIARKDHANRYRYQDGKHTALQRNGDYRSTDVQVQLGQRLGRDLELSGTLWLQGADRQVSPSRTAVYNQDRQSDRNGRYSVKAKYLGQAWSAEVKAAYFDEYLGFFTNAIDSRANNYVHMQEAQAQRWLGETKVGLTLYRRVDVLRSNFDINTSRNRRAMALAVERPWMGLSWRFHSRQEWVDDAGQPFTVQLGVGQQSQRHSWSLDLAKSYNLPTFNDLYWPELGNPDLKAEDGYQANLRYQSQVALAGGQVEPSISAQYHYVDNWILWSPLNGIWKPKNQRAVRHIGVEVGCGWLWAREKHQWSGKVSTEWNRTEVAKDDLSKEILGNQLIYIPRWKGMAQLRYQRKATYIQAEGKYVGRRYSDTKNLTNLEAYTTMDLTIGHQLTDVHLYFSIKNIGNTVYENIPYFPTPLRFFNMGFTLLL